MNFGRNLKPPKTFFEDETGHFSNPVEDLQGNQTKMCTILDTARNNLSKAQVRQAKYFNKKKSNWVPNIGEIVYKKEYYQSKALESFAAKLAPNYSGPYEVKSFLSPTIVEIMKENDESNKVFRVHLKDLKRVNQDDFSFSRN